jgi:hypothetical protein
MSQHASFLRKWKDKVMHQPVSSFLFVTANYRPYAESEYLIVYGALSWSEVKRSV